MNGPDNRLGAQLSALERFYGLLPSPPRDLFALFVWEVLDAQSAPGKRDAAFAALKRARVLTPDAMARAPRRTLEGAVALTGAYQEQRLSALRAGVDRFRRHPQLAGAIRGPLLMARRALNRLSRPGADAAHRMLLLAGNHPILPVDSRVQRVAQRLGYGTAGGTPRASARSIRRALTRELPRDAAAMRRAYVYLSHHAAAGCAADPHCDVCPLAGDCPEGKRRHSRAGPKPHP